MGVKQGCVLSPLLFNLFINKLPGVYDSLCDPVYIKKDPISCLMFADDCVVLSQSMAGLQRAINKTANHFESLGLSVNVSKTKVIIFNSRGLSPRHMPQYVFNINGSPLVNCESYVYLGLIFKPSGAVTAAVKELHAKASRAWFSISNIVYQNKRMPVSRALKLFDSLVSPISLYGCEFWTPLNLPASCFIDQDSFLRSWETFLPELHNQRVCRMVLSVHKKASRLAILGELSRYPVLLKAISQCLKYEWSLLNHTPANSIVALAFNEIQELADSGIDCWLSKVNKMKSLLGIGNIPSHFSPLVAGKKIKKLLQSKFESFWLKEINKTKLGQDGEDHNKLRFYKQLKGCFKREPYIDLVNNRNQRACLTRLRVSSHQL